MELPWPWKLGTPEGVTRSCNLLSTWQFLKPFNMYDFLGLHDNFGKTAGIIDYPLGDN